MTLPETTPVLPVGLTGGIGSGKSTVAALLAEHGAAVIDADQIAREVVAPGEPALGEIANAFGRDMIGPDGGLDRRRMAQLVFAEPSARRQLEAITHPHIEARIASAIEGILAASDDDPPLVVVDHPLLVEAGLAETFDAVVVVLADVSTRVRRLVGHRGMEEADAYSRMEAQADDETRLAASTHVVHNDGTLEDLRPVVARLYAELTDRKSRARS